MYEACGEGFPEPTEYIRRMLSVTHCGRRGRRGVDLCLQLAGHRPAADRLGQVSGKLALLSRTRCITPHPAFRARRGYPPRARHNSIPRSRAACRPVPRTPPHARARIRTRSGSRRARRDRGSDRAGARSPADISGCGDVVRLVLKDLPPLFLRQLPPGRRFLDRDQRRAGRLGAAELGLHGRELFLFGALGVADMAGDAGQPPRGERGQDRQRDRGRMDRPTAPASAPAPRPSPA